MHFTSAAAVLALVASAFAQTADFDPILTPEAHEEVPSGKTFEVTWTAPAKYADGTISISLIGGADQGTQVPLADIASGIANSAQTYSWAVDASLGAEAVYGLIFTLESDTTIFQYSNPFTIKASGAAGTGHSTGASTVTKTTHTGIKTVTLSSKPYSTPHTTTSVKTTTPEVTSTSAFLNTTTTISIPKITQTVITTTAVVEPSTTAPAVVPTATPGAATRIGAGSVALLGVAMAFLAL